MIVTIEEVNETRKKLIVSISVEEILEEEKTLLKEFIKQVRIPGFRPGKAPPKLVRSRHAKDFAAELNRKLSAGAYEKATEEAGMDISSVIAMDEAEFDSSREGQITFTVDINPEFNLPEYKGIKTEVGPEEVSDEEIETALEELRKQRSSFDVVERTAAQGDFVKVSYEGEIAGRPIAEIVPGKPIWGKQENTWEEAGAEKEELGVSAVVESLVGMNVGEKKETEMEFPEDFKVAELAGKKANYKIEVHEVRARALPELDDKFLESMKLESVEQLKDQIFEDLENRKKYRNRQAKRQQIMDELNSRVEFPLPESALESETESAMRDIMLQNMDRGVPESEFEKHKEEIYENARRAAARRVKTGILISRIAKEEKISVEQEDMQAAIFSQAMATRTKPKEFVRQIEKDPVRLQALRRSALTNKVLEWLVQQSVEETKSD